MVQNRWSRILSQESWIAPLGGENKILPLLAGNNPAKSGENRKTFLIMCQILRTWSGVIAKRTPLRTARSESRTKYLVRKKDFDSRSSRLQIREANLRESLLVWKLKMPRPPFPKDWWQVIRLTISIRDPQRKGHTRLFTFEITHLWTHKTAER